MSTNKLIRAGGIIGLGIIVSRLLGFVRDVAIVRFFGAGMLTDAFVVAWRLPNLFRDMLAEGAANAAFVPVFSEYRIKYDFPRFCRFVNTVFWLLLVITASFTLLGICFSPTVVRIIAPGFSAFPEKLKATVYFTRILFPYLIFVSLAAYAMAVLNTLGHFLVPAFSSSLLNLAIIASVLLSGGKWSVLILGVLVGGLLQFFSQAIVIYKKGLRIGLSVSLSDPYLGVIGKLMLPRLVSSSLYQLNNFVDSFFASFVYVVDNAAVTLLYFPYHLVLFPLAIFSTSLAQAVLPFLSQQAAMGQEDKLKETFSHGIRISAVVLFPAAVILMVLARPIIFTLFQSGKFTPAHAHIASGVLFFYSIGLVAYGWGRMLQACFFALQDTVTVAKGAAVNLGLNIILNAIFMVPLRLYGIALATSLSGIITTALLFFWLKRKIKVSFRNVLSPLGRIILACILMGITVGVLYLLIGIGDNQLSRIIHLGVLLSAACGVYFILAVVLRIEEIRHLCQILSVRR